MEAEEKRRQRDVSIKYAVLKEDKTKVPICQASFLRIFCKYKDFLITIVTSFSYFCISTLLFELFLVFFFFTSSKPCLFSYLPLVRAQYTDYFFQQLLSGNDSLCGIKGHIAYLKHYH